MGSWCLSQFQAQSFGTGCSTDQMLGVISPSSLAESLNITCVSRAQGARNIEN